MRLKPRSEWHNYWTSDETRFGPVDAAISFNHEVAKRFLEDLQDRVDRGTGIRFVVRGTGARERVYRNDNEASISYQVFERDIPYIFPNKSPHTDRYDSPWNRVEIYIPEERYIPMRNKEDDQEDQQDQY